MQVIPWIMEHLQINLQTEYFYLTSVRVYNLWVTPNHLEPFCLQSVIPAFQRVFSLIVLRKELLKLSQTQFRCDFYCFDNKLVTLCHILIYISLCPVIKPFPALLQDSVFTIYYEGSHRPACLHKYLEEPFSCTVSLQDSD